MTVVHLTFKARRRCQHCSALAKHDGLCLAGEKVAVFSCPECGKSWTGKIRPRYDRTSLPNKARHRVRCEGWTMRREVIKAVKDEAERLEMPASRLAEKAIITYLHLELPAEDGGQS